jgi:hypothetical protein
VNVDAATLQLDLYEGLKDHDLADDVAYNKLVKADIVFAWHLYADKAAVGPRARYLYAKRHVLERLLERNWQAVDVEIGGPQPRGVVERKRQKFLNLTELYDRVTVELRQLARGAGGRRPGVITSLTRTAPIMPAAGTTLDANHVRYRGDPYAQTLAP